MPDRRFVLKGREILEMSGLPNSHRFALRSQVSYPSVDRYLNHPEDQRNFSADVLAMILTHGIGKTPDEILAMPLSAFFDIIEEDR